MRAKTHAEAKAIIKREHVRVVCVERVKGGLRYQCAPRSKKQSRKTPFTIVIKDIKVKKS